MSHIYPVVLCGGIGTRLWPLSRTRHPKQFQTIGGQGSATFFQSTVQRHRHPQMACPVVCVNDDYVGLARSQLHEIGCPAHIIGEPVARNTGAAVLSAAKWLLERDRQAIVLVLPSDHVIHGDLNEVVLRAREAAVAGMIVMFGIVPKYPETGYGYIVDGGANPAFDGLRQVAEFVEKPNLDQASRLLRDGNAYWSSGISMFRADVLISQYRRFDPTTCDAVTEALASASNDQSGVTLLGAAFADANDEATERAVFERSDRMAFIPADVLWSDVGAWSAIHDVGNKNSDGNIESGDVLTIGCQNSYIRASNRLTTVVGMHDVIVVDMDDALLVTTKENSQNVKTLVQELTKRNRREVSDHRMHANGHGHLKLLQMGEGYSLEAVDVLPGCVVRLAEVGEKRRQILIADGDAWVRDGTHSTHLVASQSIELGGDHPVSLINEGAIPLIFIHVIFDGSLPVASLAPIVETAIKSSGQWRNA